MLVISRWEDIIRSSATKVSCWSLPPNGRHGDVNVGDAATDNDDEMPRRKRLQDRQCQVTAFQSKQDLHPQPQLGHKSNIDISSQCGAMYPHQGLQCQGALKRVVSVLESYCSYLEWQATTNQAALDSMICIFAGPFSIDHVDAYGSGVDGGGEGDEDYDVSRCSSSRSSSRE